MLPLWLYNILQRWSSRCLVWGVRTCGRTEVLHGIPVTVSFPDSVDADALLRKIEAALELISLHAPRAFEHVDRHVEHIVIGSPLGCIGKYLADLRWCLLDDAWILRERITPAAVAMTIVHEATHGRLHRLGIPYTNDNRIRVERLCMKAEITLAARMPGCEPLRQWAEQISRDAEEHWSLEKWRRDRVNALRRFHISQWLAVLLQRITEPPRSLTRRP